MVGTDTETVRATETSFAVLRTLRARGGAGVTEVAEALDVPKSTAHKHLHTLERIGYATNDGGTYDVALPAVGIGQYARTRDSLFDAARPVVDRLADTTGEVAGLLVERGGRGFDVYRSGEGAFGDPATAVPDGLHSSAPGKAVLASFSPDAVDEVVEERGLDARTPQTVTDRAALDAELERVRDRGIAFDREESHGGVHAVAVPVRDGEATRGAVYVVGPKRRLTGKWFDENIPGMVVSAVSTVSRGLRDEG